MEYLTNLVLLNGLFSTVGTGVASGVEFHAKIDDFFIVSGVFKGSVQAKFSSIRFLWFLRQFGFLIPGTKLTDQKTLGKTLF